MEKRVKIRKTVFGGAIARICCLALCLCLGLSISMTAQAASGKKVTPVTMAAVVGEEKTVTQQADKTSAALGILPAGTTVNVCGQTEQGRCFRTAVFLRLFQRGTGLLIITQVVADSAEIEIRNPLPVAVQNIFQIGFSKIVLSVFAAAAENINPDVVIVRRSLNRLVKIGFRSVRTALLQLHGPF